MSEKPSAGSPSPPDAAPSSAPQPTPTPTPAPTATTAAATVNVPTIRTATTTTTAATTTTTAPITTATSTTTGAATTTITPKTTPTTPSAQLSEHGQPTQASVTTPAPIQLQLAKVAPRVSQSHQAQTPRLDQPVTAVPPTEQHQPPQPVSAAPTTEHNRSPQQPTQQAGQEQFQAVRFATNYGVPNQQPQPYPPQQQQQQQQQPFSQHQPYSHQPPPPPAFQSPLPPINDPLRNQFYDILGELDPFKATPKEFIHLLVHAAVRDGEIARSLFRLNHDRLQYPQFWRPPVPPDMAARPKPGISTPARLPSNTYIGPVLRSSAPAAPPSVTPSAATPATPSGTSVSTPTSAPTGVPASASIGAPASASTDALASSPAQQNVSALESTLKRKRDSSDGQKSVPHPTSRMGMGPPMVMYWGPQESPAINSGQAWNPGFPPQHQLQMAPTTPKYPPVPSSGPHGVPTPVATSLPIVSVQATTSTSAAIDNGIEVINGEPKEQSCNFTWALDRAETHLGFTGNYDKMSEVRQLSTGYEVALKVQKLLKKLNVALDKHVTFANRVHILTVMREIIAATLEANHTVGKECRECSREFDSTYHAAVRKLTPQQLQRLKALESGKWLQEMQDLVDEADKQALFPLLRRALDHLNAAA